MFLTVRNLCLYIICIFICSCANQRPPTGGEKDEIAPELISSNPAHESINFSGDEIELTFNEQVKLKDAKAQLLITPRISDEYEIKYKKDRILIELAQPLDSNTTYTFSFREAVQDLNEGNPAENLKLAFSTGDFLDSLSISGSVRNILSDTPAKDFTVSLYQIGDTLNPLEDPPLYLTKTNESGYFIFENLRSDRYHLIAVNDKNNNLIIDSKSESYGFLSDTLNLISNLDSLEVNTQVLDIRPLEFQGARQSGTTYNLKFNKYVRDYSLFNLDRLPIISNYSSPDHNTIQVFNTLDISDSLFTVINATDTLFQSIMDTTHIRYEETSRQPKDMSASIELNYVPQTTRQLNATLTFSKPITTINYDSAYIYLDSLNIIPLDSAQIVPNQLLDQYYINYTFNKSLFEGEKENSKQTKENRPSATQEKIQRDSTKDSTNQSADSTQQTPPPKEQNPHIYFAKNTFISVENDSSELIRKDLSFKRTDQLATLLFEVVTSSPSYLLQILTKQGEVIDEFKNPSSGSINTLQPGDYQLRLIIDENQNGVWDPGNYYEREQPEPIVFYRNSENQKIITLRANWELGPLIIEY